MTPEEEKELSSKIFQSLLQFEGYIRSLNIKYTESHEVLIRWDYWIEEKPKGSRGISKTFYSHKNELSISERKFMRNFEEQIKYLDESIAASISISESDAMILKDLTPTNASYVTIAIPQRTDPFDMEL